MVLLCVTVPVLPMLSITWVMVTGALAAATRGAAGEVDWVMFRVEALREKSLSGNAPACASVAAFLPLSAPLFFMLLFLFISIKNRLRYKRHGQKLRKERSRKGMIYLAA